MVPGCIVEVDRRLRGAYCLYHQDHEQAVRVFLSAITMEAVHTC
jgi:hypothetical protein